MYYYGLLCMFGLMPVSRTLFYIRCSAKRDKTGALYGAIEVSCYAALDKWRTLSSLRWFGRPLQGVAQVCEAVTTVGDKNRSGQSLRNKLSGP